MVREQVLLTDTQRLDWLRLIRSDNVGPRTFRALITQYGGAGAALAALPDLARRGGAERLPRICSRAEAERELSAARDLGVAGFVIVSGLARGIDASAHRASLATGTVAALAGGHARIYPAEHADLLDAFLAAGAAVSEMPL